MALGTKCWCFVNHRYPGDLANCISPDALNGSQTGDPDLLPALGVSSPSIYEPVSDVCLLMFNM